MNDKTQPLHTRRAVDDQTAAPAASSAAIATTHESLDDPRAARHCTTCGKDYPASHQFCALDGHELSFIRPDNDDPLVGRSLDGRWVIRRRIDSGAMGTVYAASQMSVDRKVAIKTLKAEHSGNPELVERFLHEARIASTITHPHCVTIYDFGQAEDGILYLAMEFLEGQSLADRLQGPPLSIPEIVEITSQIASGLSAAHAERIVHRDLKPANVFLVNMPDGGIFVKVLDFGIAKALDSTQKLTNAGELFGTPWYMSPEQSLGETLDGRSDLYALGCILYEMLTGQPPFDAQGALAVLTAHIHAPVRPLHEVTQRSDIPPALEHLCLQLLEKKREQRPADATTTRATLKALADELGSDAGSALRPATDAYRAAPTGHTNIDSRNAPTLFTQAQAPDMTMPVPAAPPGSPLPWLIALGVVASVFALGTIAAIWSWLTHGSPDILVP